MQIADDRAGILKTVRTPLCFFALVVLSVNVIFVGAALAFPDQHGVLVVAMISLMFLLVLIVAFLTYFKPQVLMRPYEDPEVARMRETFQGIEHLASKIIGGWTFVTKYAPGGGQQKVEVRGSCEISKGTYGISIHGKCTDEKGIPGRPFVVKQVFLNEDGLTFIFEVPVGLGRVILGVGQVGFTSAEGESRINQMRGNWAVLGSRVGGEAEFDRPRSG